MKQYYAVIDTNVLVSALLATLKDKDYIIDCFREISINVMNASAQCYASSQK